MSSMNTKTIIILLCSSMCVYVAASDSKNSYSYWVQKAATISIYGDGGCFLVDVPINEKVTLNDVKSYLQKIRIAHASVPYSLHPLYNQIWRLGRWNYSSEPLADGKIKDHMNHYDTDKFWIKVKSPKSHQS